MGTKDNKVKKKEAGMWCKCNRMSKNTQYWENHDYRR